MSAVCPRCLDALGGKTWTCPRCSTTLHEDCHHEHGQCPVYGCAVVRWRDLSDQDKQGLRAIGELNGCGGKGSFVPVPDFLFTASCDHHDFNYWVGGDEADRLKADWEFLQAMLRDVEARGSWWNRWWLRGTARVYYWAVRRFASRYFHHGHKRTRVDLDTVLKTTIPLGRSAA